MPDERVPDKGAGIGLYRHDRDEALCVVSGEGRDIVDGTMGDVGPGDAMLTRVGSTHALQQAGDEDLVIVPAHPKDNE